MSATETAAQPQAGRQRASAPLVSVVIPCLDEAESVGKCVRDAYRTLEEAGIAGEVIVADNGSSDGSVDLAEQAGARVVREPRRGYGSAILAGLSRARGKYVIIADADDSYDFTQIGAFITPLEEGADVVMGSRRNGNIHRGAMPWLHRYVGNPILTGVLNLFFRTGVSDAHCGMRAFRRDLLPRLDLRTTGMEFASEHVIRSSKLGLDMREVPIDYRPRAGESKLSSFSDGWRHLRFLLVHSPTWLFVVPGALLLFIGMLMGTIVVLEVDLFAREWQLHTLIGASMLAIVGSQILQLGISARTYAAYHFGEHDRLFDQVRAHLRLEHGLIIGSAMLVGGMALAAVVLGTWVQRGFGQLGEEKLAIAGVTLVVLGTQTIFGAFFLSVLGVRRRHHSMDEPEAPRPD